MQLPIANTQEAQDELAGSMTVMYMLIQHALVYPEELHELQSDLGMFSCFWPNDTSLIPC